MSSPSKVLEGLWQGGSEVLMCADWFESQGITHAVSACASEPEMQGMTVLHVGIRDDEEANVTQHFRRVIEFIHGARVTGGSVYVFCAQGVSRSSALVAAYLMVVGQCTADQALRFLICKRPVAFPNLGFYRQLYTFQKTGGAADILRELQESPGHRHDEVVNRDATEIQQVLDDPSHKDVDVSAFEACIREPPEDLHCAAGAGDLSGPEVDGVLLWRDTVITRGELELQVDAPDCKRHLVPAGARIQVIKRNGLDDLWEGAHNGRVGTFSRKLVREPDCAESEDEDEYQASLGHPVPP